MHLGHLPHPIGHDTSQTDYSPSYVLDTQSFELWGPPTDPCVRREPQWLALAFAQSLVSHTHNHAHAACHTHDGTSQGAYFFVASTSVERVV